MLTEPIPNFTPQIRRRATAHGHGRLEAAAKIGRDGMGPWHRPALAETKPERKSNRQRLAYGAALNEGRAMFASNDDVNFGEWKRIHIYNNLLEIEDRPNAPEESAAMWGAAHPDQFTEARAAGNASDEQFGQWLVTANLAVTSRIYIAKLVE